MNPILKGVPAFRAFACLWDSPGILRDIAQSFRNPGSGVRHLDVSIPGLVYHIISEVLSLGPWQRMHAVGARKGGSAREPPAST